MGRMNWDRLRRTRPLDGADERVDPDGAHLWEREGEARAGAPAPFGARRLRTGIIVRRRAAVAEGAPKPLHAPAILRCRDCGAVISPRKLLRHKRRCPAKTGTTETEAAEKNKLDDS